MRLWWNRNEIAFSTTYSQCYLGHHWLIKDLETAIMDLEKIFVSTGNQGHFEVHKSKKYLNRTVTQALVLSCVLNASGMDLSSRLFFCLENKNGQNKFDLFFQTQGRSHWSQSEGGPSSFIHLCISVGTLKMKNFYKPFYEGLLKVSSDSNMLFERSRNTDLSEYGCLENSWYWWLQRKEDVLGR